MESRKSVKQAVWLPSSSQWGSPGTPWALCIVVPLLSSYTFHKKKSEHSPARMAFVISKSEHSGPLFRCSQVSQPRKTHKVCRNSRWKADRSRQESCQHSSRETASLVSDCRHLGSFHSRSENSSGFFKCLEMWATKFSAKKKKKLYLQEPQFCLVISPRRLLDARHSSTPPQLFEGPLFWSAYPGDPTCCSQGPLC